MYFLSNVEETRSRRSTKILKSRLFDEVVETLYPIGACSVSWSFRPVVKNESRRKSDEYQVTLTPRRKTRAAKSCARGFRRIPLKILEKSSSIYFERPTNIANFYVFSNLTIARLLRYHRTNHLTTSSFQRYTYFFFFLETFFSFQYDTFHLNSVL